MLRSPPSRRRGLKSAHSLSPITNIVVASFAEAWIEISLSDLFAFWEWSPPSRRRGLKYGAYKTVKAISKSPPSRRRGLKFILFMVFILHTSRLLRGGVDWNKHIMTWEHGKIVVASFAEAWIEISTEWSYNVSNRVASFAEAWIEIFMSFLISLASSVASFAEAWIEIWGRCILVSASGSPPSRRRGLKSKY